MIGRMDDVKRRSKMGNDEEGRGRGKGRNGPAESVVCLVRPMKQDISSNLTSLASINSLNACYV